MIRAAERARLVELLHRPLHGGRGHLEAVAQARVGRVEQPPELVHVPALERRHGCVDALVLGDDVRPRDGSAATAAPRLRRASPSRRLGTPSSSLARGGIPAGARCSQSRRWSARHRSAGDQLERAELELHRRGLERAKVDPQRAVVLAEQRCELVEQARLGADPVVLDLRADLASSIRSGSGVSVRGDQRKRQRGPRAPPTTTAATARHVSRDVHARGADRHAGALQLRDRAAHERRASRAPRGGRASSNASCLWRSVATASSRSPAIGLARTVTPSLIANGSARPWL